MDPQQTPRPLWTWDFTILTLGSVVSMVGNVLANFAMSLLVLDLTGSPMLYAVYIALYALPQMIVPVFSGAILDRFSRKRTIYTLDFISAGLFALAMAALWGGWFNFTALVAFSVITGSIDSMYSVAYQSFYPLLITEGNYSKAYSVASLLEMLTMVMAPVSAVVYNAGGILPLFGVNAVSYFIAALMEMRIGAEEKYTQGRREVLKSEKNALSRLLRDVKEGVEYLRGERGLAAVAVYFAFSAMVGGATSALTLPWFKATFANGEYYYILVQGAAMAGRAIGSSYHYKRQLPARWKYTVALTVYIVLSVIDGIYLFLPIWVMAVLFLIYGMLGVTSFTIRISATQSYVPDEKKGRFNGVFEMLSTTGMFAGTLLAGALGTVLPQRGVILAFSAVGLAAALIFIGGRGRDVAAVYNRQQ